MKKSTDYPACSQCGRLVPAYANVKGVSTCLKCVGSKIAVQEEEIRRLRSAVAWALGANGHFPLREEGDGAYWWRTELQSRARLKWDGEKFVPTDLTHGGG